MQSSIAILFLVCLVSACLSGEIKKREVGLSRTYLPSGGYGGSQPSYNNGNSYGDDDTVTVGSPETFERTRQYNGFPQNFGSSQGFQPQYNSNNGLGRSSQTYGAPSQNLAQYLPPSQRSSIGSPFSQQPQRYTAQNGQSSQHYNPAASNSNYDSVSPHSQSYSNQGYNGHPSNRGYGGNHDQPSNGNGYSGNQGYSSNYPGQSGRYQQGSPFGGQAYTNNGGYAY